MPFIGDGGRCWGQGLPGTKFGEKGEIMKRVVFILIILPWIAGGVSVRGADLPANFPAITTHVYDSTTIGKGYIYLAVAADVEGVGFYLMILDNDGTPKWYRELPDDYAYDFKLQTNGLPTYAQLLNHHSYAGGGDAVHTVMDKDFKEIDSFQMGNGYIAESHDFQWLANGHALLFGYYMTQVDLSKLVLGGYPNAVVSGGVVQELDADRNVVFQWRTWDHYSFEDYSWDSGSASPIISEFHLNTINMDVDGNLFIATPEWVKKINRQTGEIMWHLGGDENEFTFIGVDPEEAAGHFGGHAFYRLDNGNVLIYDGGSRDGTLSSQVHEYKLDEENKTAEHIWSYVPEPGVYGWHQGNAQRLSNGNTFIGWGGDGSKDGPACTEVTPDGRKVFELFFDDSAIESYRAFRLPLPADISGVGVVRQYVGIGEHKFKQGQTDTGVTIRINSYTGTGYNVMGVVRVPLAPLYPTFEGRAPIVLPVRVQVGADGIITINGRISFNAASFGLEDPNTLIIYHRKVQAAPFTALPTSYDPATGKLRADMTAFGEFIIGKPDLEHVALSPILIAPESEGTVNEALPVALDWTPRGFVNTYHLQVATDPNFNELLVDDPNITDTPYVMETVEAGKAYYWRVRTINDAGQSEWSEDVFETVPPTVRVTVPNGGEQWGRGIDYFIQWDDNLAEDVVIELYKGGSWLQIIDTVPSTGAYKWEASLTLEPGEDYSIQIKSKVNEIMADVCDAAFTIN
jgi:hypothetical protein